MTRLLNPEGKKENYKSPECPKIIWNCKHSSIFKYEFLSPENNQIMEFHLMLIFFLSFQLGGEGVVTLSFPSWTHWLATIPPHLTREYMEEIGGKETELILELMLSEYNFALSGFVDVWSSSLLSPPLSLSFYGLLKRYSFWKLLAAATPLWGQCPSLGAASFQFLVLQRPSPQVLSLLETHYSSRRSSWTELKKKALG